MARNKKPVVRLGAEFSRDLARFTRRVETWSRQSRAKLRAAHRRIGQRHRTEAIRRVPVDEGRLRNAILTNTFFVGQDLITETGTNVRDYPVFLEFGTRHIAGGRVMALGPGIGITDAQAIKDWPAKAEGLEGAPALVGRSREQMPWLRPAFQTIRTWAIAQLDSALEPPPA